MKKFLFLVMVVMVNLLFITNTVSAAIYNEEGNVENSNNRGINILSDSENDAEGKEDTLYRALEANTTEESDWSNPFVDVSESSWYYTYVKYAVINNLFKGTNNNTFSPDTPMTRAMLVTVLYRLEGQPTAGASNTFVDVKSGEWFTDAVIWASHNGIVKGVGDNRFDPDGNLTREQLVTILYRYAENKGYDVSRVGDASSFSDYNRVSAYAITPMNWAYQLKLIGGTKVGDILMIDPQGNATRAQVAKILTVFLDSKVYAFETLKSYLLKNGTYLSSSNWYCLSNKNQGFTTTLIYDASEEALMWSEHYVSTSEGEITCFLCIPETSSMYEVKFIDEISSGTFYGLANITPKSFTSSAKISFSSFSGNTAFKTTCESIASSMVCITLSSAEIMLNSYNIGISISDFGFTSFK